MLSQESSLSGIEELARLKLPPDIWLKLGATETGSTYHRNIEAFKKLLLKQRVFHGISSADTSLDLFGQRIGTPILVAPVGIYSTLGKQTELEVTSGAKRANSMMFVAFSFETALERIVSSEHPPLVWQGYFRNGFEDVRDKVKKAESLGFAAVGVSVDTVQPPKMGDTLLIQGRGAGISVTIKEVEKLRKETSLPFFVKGIMCEEDALMARDAGADAIIVSNHGGRILDYSRSTIEALPGIVKAVGGGSKGTTVLVDGGIRRGTDVLKALALGAKAVLIGRPVFWSVAVDGSDGVATVITKLTEELKRSMVICGVSSLDKIDERILIRDTTHPL